MTANNTDWIPIEDFTAPRQILLFQNFKQSQTSGQLLMEDETGRTWSFHLYLGRIVYASGGEHALRRWRRYLATYMPQIAYDPAKLKQDLAAITAEDLQTGWEYQLLCLWINQKKITREQAVRMVSAILIEVLFDVTQAGNIIYQLNTDKSVSTLLIVIDAEQVIGEAWKQWSNWRVAKLGDLSPNSVPTIRKLEELKSHSSATTYQAFTKSLNGNRSLRDLAMQLNQDIVTLTRLLMPYVRSEFIEFVSIQDLPSPISQAEQEEKATELKKGSIALIDDDFYFCRQVEKLLTPVGYSFISISEPFEAIAILFSRQPDLIFLNLNLPHVNGYEMCSEFRKLPSFRQTPIVILTNSVNIGDRVKAKMVGCSGFFSKSGKLEDWLDIITQHLEN